MCLERIFPLCQTLDGAPAVTGVALLRIQLGDVFQSNTEIPYAALKGEHAPGRLSGTHKVEVLCDDLSIKTASQHHTHLGEPGSCSAVRAGTSRSA